MAETTTDSSGSGADRSHAKPCRTYETTSGDHTVRQTCGETWATGRPPACERAIALLTRVGNHVIETKLAVCDGPEVSGRVVRKSGGQ